MHIHNLIIIIERINNRIRIKTKEKEWIKRRRIKRISLRWINRSSCSKSINKKYKLIYYYYYYVEKKTRRSGDGTDFIQRNAELGPQAKYFTLNDDQKERVNRIMGNFNPEEVY